MDDEARHELERLAFSEARSGRAASLEWRDIDLQTRRVRIERGLCEGHRAHRVAACL